MPSTFRLIAGALLLGTALAAQAQSPFTRPVRLIVPFSPGGPTDTIGRIIALQMAEKPGVNVIVDNRPGASGTIGADIVAKAAPDGHTLLLCSSGLLITSPLTRKVPYDPVRDLAHVTVVATFPYLLLVNPASGPESVKAFVERARADPGKLKYGSAGVASTSHLAGAMFGYMAGIDLVHVPYKGSAGASTDLIGGHIDFTFEAIAAGIQYVRSKRLRALGVSTRERIAALPDLPTIAEAGVPGYEMRVAHGVCAPGRTPPATVEAVAREVIEAARAPETRKRLASLGAELLANTPAQFHASVVDEIARWKKLLDSGAVKLD